VTLGCGAIAEAEECVGPPAAVTRLPRWRVRRSSRGEARRRREVEERAGAAADATGRGRWEERDVGGWVVCLWAAGGGWYKNMSGGP
jgi:hypothetical protein